MNYRRRHLEWKLERFRHVSSVVLITGARQVGKSTLLTHALGPGVPQVVFDPVVDVAGAREDPEFFLDQHPPPIILDEIQYAPELLSAIKRRVDRNPSPGQYFLSGSQNLALLKGVSESLAGRVMILDLMPMTLAERCDLAGEVGRSWIQDVLDAGEDLPDLHGRKRIASGANDTLFSRLWRGGYPRTLDVPVEMMDDVLMSYVRTYVERDVRLLAEVSEQQTFTRFLSLCAALTAQEVNYSQLGREIGVTPQTGRRWLDILSATFQWIRVPPYHGNAIKRISGRPKGYLSDSGLCAYLQRISSPQSLAGHPSLGPLFETHVLADLRGQFSLLGMPPQLYHWRTHGGAEVDLLLERDGVFWPIEIKCRSRIAATDCRGIRAFRETYPALRHGPGIVVAAAEEVVRLPERVIVAPYDLR